MIRRGIGLGIQLWVQNTDSASYLAAARPVATLTRLAWVATEPGSQKVVVHHPL